ncbi:MAG: ATPase, partial [Faecalibacterium prausnitzii]
LFDQMTADYEAETQKKRTAGLLDKPTLEARLQTAKTLRSWEKELLRAAAPDADAAFKVLRTQFGTLSDARDTAQQTASAALEAAFDFMEQAFAESQEMVVFVTELTLSPAAHAFIAENGCERYFQYNKDLLLDHRKAALNQELEAEQRRHGML